MPIENEIIDKTETNETEAKIRFVSGAEICEMVNLDSRTLDRLVSIGRFPKPIRLGPRTRRWNLDKVLAWLESREGQ